jgi:adenylate kinase family enzyme
MKKVLVIGSSGAGKSTFARRLGEITGLEVIHLDRHFWNPGWVETPKPEWRDRVAELLSGESWIIDGNFGGTMEMRLAACDTVIFLDMPRLVCTWRVIKRVITYREGTRPDISPGCAERVDLGFWLWTFRFPKRSRPQVEERLKKVEDSKTIYRLRSGRAVERFLTDLESIKSV